MALEVRKFGLKMLFSMAILPFYLNMMPSSGVKARDWMPTANDELRCMSWHTRDNGGWYCVVVIHSSCLHSLWYY